MHALHMLSADNLVCRNRPNLSTDKMYRACTSKGQTLDKDQKYTAGPPPVLLLPVLSPVSVCACLLWCILSLNFLNFRWAPEAVHKTLAGCTIDTEMKAKRDNLISELIALGIPKAKAKKNWGGGVDEIHLKLAVMPKNIGINKLKKAKTKAKKDVGRINFTLISVSTVVNSRFSLFSYGQSSQNVQKQRFVTPPWAVSEPQGRNSLNPFLDCELQTYPSLHSPV